MIEKKRVWIGIIFVFGIILFLNFINSYATSNVQFTQYQPPPGLFGLGSSLDFDSSMCKEGQDFLIQIAPFGCTPAVVRSDLLEEQSVPIFCQLAATKINPLIDVKAIESLSFIGEYPPEVAGIGFEPYRSALGGKGNLNTPTILDNIGYAVIVLKKQQNESAMPDFVEGNLSVKIKYDIKNAYGIGKTSFYLPVLTDDEWNERKNQYSFWNGKGFLRVEGIEGNQAKIAIYDGTNRKFKSVVLEKGGSSDKIYLPGFYCLSSLELKLSGLEAPDTRAKLRIDNDYIEVKKGEKFLDGRCTVTDLYEAGILDRVTISCKEDESGGFFGSSTHILSIVPKLKLSINGVEGEYGVGDFLYKYKEEGKAREYYVYLAYANTKNDTGLEKDLEIGIISIPKESNTEDNKLDDGSINYVGRLARADWDWKKGKSNAIDIVREAGQLVIGLISNSITRIVTGKSVTWISHDGIVGVLGEESSILNTTVYGNRKIGILGFSEPIDINLDIANSDMAQARKYYDLADNDFETIINSYALEKTDNEKVNFGEEALGKLIELNIALGQKRKVVELCEEFEKAYKIAFERCGKISISNSDIDTTLVTINGRTRRITLGSIYEPDLTEFSAEVLVKGPNGKSDVITLGKGRTIYLDDFRGKDDEIFNLSYELLVRFDSEQWQWNYRGSGWESVSENSPEIYAGTLSKKHINLLSSLRNKNFNEGHRIILTEQGYFQESIELLDLDNEYATLRVSIWGKDVTKMIKDTLVSNSQKLILGKPQTFGSGYSFTLSKVHLKKNARVTVNPGIDNTGSQTNFSFKVGIEKRGIQLSPGKARSMINNLNDSIEKWDDASKKLGTVVKGLKTGCLVAGVALTVKNFFANVGGQGIARQEVMRSEGGWYDTCADNVSRKEYASLDECYSKNSNKINKDVELVYRLQQQQQEKIKRRQEGFVKSGGILQDSVVDTNKYMEKAIPEVRNYLETTKTHIITDPKTGKGGVNGAQFLDYIIWKAQGTFTPEDLRDIELNAMILNEPDASDNLKKSAKDKLNSMLGKIYTASEEHKKTAEVVGLYNFSISDSVPIPQKDLKVLPYTGKIGSDFPGFGIDSDTPVQLVSHTEGDFIVVLEKTATGDYGVKREDIFDPEDASSSISLLMVYDARTLNEVDVPPKELYKVIFKKADESTYKNKGFKNPTIHFYETPPYEGLPAIVPFDTKNGWYAATKQTLPVLGGIAAYDKSGRVSSFWLCHVGNNGLQEFRSGMGDDICQMINIGTGMAYNQFPGLKIHDAEKYIKCGIDAIEQASRLHKSGKTIKISTACGTASSDVGNPAVDLPEIQCQDFMSPGDCKLLYNLCDPVICPSSRCDFGGAYPVKDPIQTGIIGGLMLCLPNFPEVYVPICLTGVKAGIDGLVSVFKQHRDCLQEQLDTGKTVGICDEIYSVNLCELFWRQSLPLAEIAIPKLIGALTGKGAGARGGGEYLGVQNAWDSASKSIDFFTQTYASNSFAAFKARSTEQIGSEFCKSYVSGVVPSMGFLDELTEPDSPFQFTARFDEIPFTTVTNPPISHYKVFYHIYAGQDSVANYKVYLKGSPESSYYRDTSTSRLVGQGYIAVGDSASETKDFTAPSGYKEVCVNVNGQEKCGFKQVTTSFALDYVRDQYVKEQTMQTDIKTESECISGSASAYSLLNPNLQEGVAEIANPSVYNYGITRICSTDNPGEGTDSSAGANGSRWVEVGICGNINIKCWVDTSKIKDITAFRTTEDEILSELNTNTLELLQKSGDYIDDKINDEIKKVETLRLQNNSEKAIQLVTKLLKQVFLNKNKARLYLLRGNIYTEIAIIPFGRELVRLEEERSGELESKKIEEIGERLAEGDWTVIANFSEKEIKKIGNAIECSDCGIKITCTSQICEAINIKLKDKKCTFISYFLTFGSCVEETKEEETEEEEIEEVLPERYETIFTKDNLIITCFSKGNGFRYDYVSKDCGKTFILRKIELKTQEFTYHLTRNLSDIIYFLKKGGTDKVNLLNQKIAECKKVLVEEVPEEVVPTQEIKGVTTFVKLVFYGDINDIVFVRWNFDINKPEVLVYPNGELKSGVLSRQVWGSNSLSLSSFVSSGMIDLDVSTINNNILRTTSLSEFKEGLIGVLSISDSGIEAENGLIYTANSRVDDVRSYLSRFNIRETPLILPTIRETQFRRATYQYSPDPIAGEMVPGPPYCLRYDESSRVWKLSIGCNDVWPGDWATSTDVNSLDIATIFEVGFWFITYLNPEYKFEKISIEVENLEIFFRDGYYKIYYLGEYTNLYLHEVELGYRVYNEESFIFESWNRDTLIGIFQFAQDRTTTSKFRSRISQGNDIYDSNPIVFQKLEEAHLIISSKGVPSFSQ